MTADSPAELWVLCDVRDKRVPQTCLEVLGAAARLARGSGAPVAAVVADTAAPEDIARLVAGGADKVYRMVFAGGGADDAAFAAAVAGAARCFLPHIILAPSTVRGRFMAAQTAAHLDVGLMADCTALTIGDDGVLAGTRSAFSGTMTITVSCTPPRPHMATLRPGAFEPLPPSHFHSAETIDFTPQPAACGGLELLAAELMPPGRKTLHDADIILSGGMGLGSKEEFAKLARLAEMTGAAPGASRAAVNAGFAPYCHQVGMTGTIVRPRLYVAFGISGAPQHLAGMASSGRIIAVNIDKKA
ncbi:MAG: electron transfer flavoprotein subunit alpha/FixB family protein, partial [Methylobacteriaceae bacterium]|nr:electron transfer flavoprotein subunit alpha/FixB family protein [Methylobacteriaceae bacterium]